MNPELPAKSLPSLFLNCAYTFKNQPLFAEKKGSQWTWLTWNDIQTAFESLGKAILGVGLAPGFKAAILCENRPEWVVTDLSIMACQGVTVPLYTTSSQSQMKFILEHSECRLFFVSRKLYSEAVQSMLAELPDLKKVIIYDHDDAPSTDSRVIGYSRFLGERLKNPADTFYQCIEKLNPDQLSCIIYTSGTTGQPKGVMLSHGNILSNIRDASSVIRVDTTDVALSFLPLSHTFERTAGMYTLMSRGARIAFAEGPMTVLANMAEIHPTVMCSVPRVLEKLYARVFEAGLQSSFVKRKIFQRAIRTIQTLKTRDALVQSFEWRIYDRLIFSKVRDKLGPRFRFFVSGGAALSPKVGQFLEAIGIPILQGYGLTETSPVIAVNRFDDRHVETVGQPIPNCEVSFAADGEILVRGPQIMLGYYKNPEATAEIIDSEKRLHTGDIGVLDERGHLRITDRKKELIATSGGKKVAPQPIENELKSHPLIEQACLVGDGHKFIAALIVPNFEVLKSRMQQKGMSEPSSKKELLLRPEVRAWYAEVIDTVNEKLASYESIKRFDLLEQEFSVDRDEITPTLKLKRRIISDRYAANITAMYHGA